MHLASVLGSTKRIWKSKKLLLWAHDVLMCPSSWLMTWIPH